MFDIKYGMAPNLKERIKKVIHLHKSPFNFIFNPELSTGLIFGEPGGTRTHDTKLKRLVL